MFMKFASSICRVCLGAEAKVSLFDGTGWDGKFKCTTNLDICEDDGLPAALCENCVARLEAAYEFQKQSLASDVRLRSFVNTINSKFATEIQESHGRSLSCNETTLQTCQENNTSSINDGKHTSLKIDIISDNVETPSQIDEQNVEEDDVAGSCTYMDLTADSCVNEDQDQKEIYTEDTRIEENTFKESVDGEEEVPEVSYYATNSLKSQHICDNCGKSFCNRTSLRRHLITHTNAKPFSCQICTSSFTQRGSLKQHMLRHTGERPHVCLLCGRGFTRRRLLLSHERTHTGEKPYRCDECNISFTVKEGLRRHNIKSHSSIQEKIYQCEICNKKLHSKYSLQNHLQLHARNPNKGQYRIANMSLINEIEEDNEEGPVVIEPDQNEGIEVSNSVKVEHDNGFV